MKVRATIRRIREATMKTTAVNAMLAIAAASAMAETTILLPAGRSFYQTNERIPLSVVRTADGALPAGAMSLALSSPGARSFRCEFAAPAGEARRVEHVSLDARLLKPGDYELAVTVDGSTAATNFTVCSHIRQSDYRLIHWGGSRNDQMAAEGIGGLGFNLAMGDRGEESIPSGQDVMGTCLMGGGHQHDLRQSNDWSDPYVTIGAIQRGVDQAFTFRTMPNAIGAHLHDEPGLTWLPHPHVKGPDGQPQWNAHDIPAQRAAFARAFGAEQPWFDELDPAASPDDLAAWSRVCEFKLGFMDALWKTSRHAFERMKPGYLPVTQSQYGWTAYHDGYYFNVVRSMPVASGHGGYNDFWLRNFNPSFFLEFSLPRQMDKPTWYLPEWYAMSPEAFREEHNLSFVTGIQGIATPPGLNASSAAAPGIAECNRRYAWLGTVFAKPAYTRQPLALLYSKSNIEYLHGAPNTQLNPLVFAYMATKLLQQPMTAVLDEDVLDGTLAASHRAVLLTGVAYLDPAVANALASFAANGGTVIETGDCNVTIPGAVRIAASPAAAWEAELEAAKTLAGDEQRAATVKANSFRNMVETAAPLADALRPALAAAGVAPAFSSSVPTIAPGRQVRGEIEYIFAVNFTPVEGYNADNGGNGYGTPAAANARIGVPDDGRPVVVLDGGPTAAFARDGGELVADVAFEGGQMLAIARPARPIAAVSLGAPVIVRDFTREDGMPLSVHFTAAIVDAKGGLVAGAAPMHVVVVDSRGETRHDIFRATEGGILAVDLPLASNDAGDDWTVTVTELVQGHTSATTFEFDPAAQCGALAGLERRALYFAPDKENVFRFFRDHRKVAVVAPDTADGQAAAQRVKDIFRPYNVDVDIVPLAAALEPRPLTDDEAATWCGTACAGSLDEATRRNAEIVGFNLPLPTILLGSAADNPLVAFLARKKVLPFALSRDMPGPGRGLVAWNTMTLGHDVEAIVCAGDDPAGLGEAVGTLFTLATGLDPLTPYILPSASGIE